jgi:hypothetical protein
LLQHTSNTSSTSATFGSTTTVGSLLVVCQSWDTSTLTALSASDTAGNSWTVAVGPTTLSGYFSQGCLYAINKAATASDVVTVTGTGATTPDNTKIAEFSGIASSSPIDVTATNSHAGTSSVPTSGAATTTNANDLIFGTSIVNSGDGTGSGFTLLDQPNGNDDEYEIVSAAGSQTANFTTANNQWMAQMIAFKAATTTGHPCPVEGQLMYNATSHVPQFCDGTSWHATK